MKIDLEFFFWTFKKPKSWNVERVFFFTLKVFFCKNEKAKNWRIKKCFLPLFFNNGGRKKAVILKAFFVGRNHEKERVFVFKLGLVEELPIWWAFTHIVEISSLPLFFICLHPIKVKEVLKLADWKLPLDTDLQSQQIHCFKLSNLSPPARLEKRESLIEKLFSHSSKDSYSMSLQPRTSAKLNSRRK